MNGIKNGIEKGWKPIPLPLKILSVLFVLWTIGSVFAITERGELGLPFFGMFLYGTAASLVVLFLDILGPLIFLFGLWNRKSWAPLLAYGYIGIFVLNGIVALFTVREQFGLPQILIPTLVSVAFIIVIYLKKIYFK